MKTIEMVKESQEQLFSQMGIEEEELVAAMRQSAERAAPHVAKLDTERHREWFSCLRGFYDSDASIGNLIWSLTDEFVAKAGGKECLPVVLANGLPVVMFTDAVVPSLKRGHFLLGFVTTVEGTTGKFPTVYEAIYASVAEIFVLPDVWKSQEETVRSIMKEAVIV